MPREMLEEARRGSGGVLSARELEILLLAARGLSNRRISENLHLAEATVRRHLANTYAKMGVSSRGEAVRMAPTLARAYQTWGEIQLARGQADRASENFVLANKRSPRFADPLEGWGEALLMKGDAAGAAAKFAQAAKLAPQWGRLHLKWGESLAKQGKTVEAQAKWKFAATLDLSAAERAELNRLLQRKN